MLARAQESSVEAIRCRANGTERRDCLVRCKQMLHYFVTIVTRGRRVPINISNIFTASRSSYRPTVALRIHKVPGRQTAWSLASHYYGLSAFLCHQKALAPLSTPCRQNYITHHSPSSREWTHRNHSCQAFHSSLSSTPLLAALAHAPLPSSGKNDMFIYPPFHTLDNIMLFLKRVMRRKWVLRRLDETSIQPSDFILSSRKTRVLDERATIRSYYMPFWYVMIIDMQLKLISPGYMYYSYLKSRWVSRQGRNIISSDCAFCRLVENCITGESVMVKPTTIKW